MSLNGIKARLGSIPPLRAYQAGRAIERILTEDMPLFIKLTEAVEKHLTGHPALCNTEPCACGYANLEEAFLPMRDKNE